MISDMVLLLIVLTGLVIMRRRGGSTFGLTRLLWNQVWRFSVAEILLYLFIYFS